MFTVYRKALRLPGVINIKDINEEPFTLRSGKKSRIYVDHASLICNVNGLKACVSGIYELIRKRITKSSFTICNVDSKASPQMCGAMSVLFDLPQIIYKGEELLQAEKGVNRQITTSGSKISNVIFIDDVGTVGGTLINVVNLLRKNFGQNLSVQAVVGLARDPEIFRKNMLSFKITPYWLVTLDEILKRYFNEFTPKQQEAIRAERKL